MQKKTLGIILTVIGAVCDIWSYTRITSITGQMHTWSPPFESYEIITIICGIFGVILIIAGIIFLSKKTTAQKKV